MYVFAFSQEKHNINKNPVKSNRTTENRIQVGNNYAMILDTKPQNQIDSDEHFIRFNWY